MVALKVMPDYPPTYGYVELIKSFILPLVDKSNEKRCVNSKRI